MNPSSHAPPGRRRGFTLIELMIALAVTAMIGAGVSAMMISVSQSTARFDGARRLAVTQRVMSGRLDAAIRSSRMVLANDAEMLVLWTGDTTANGAPDLSELLRIERDAATNELVCFAPPPDLSAASDVAYGLASDFDAVTAALVLSDGLERLRWGGSVAAWSPIPNDADVRRATLVVYRLTLQGPEAGRTMTGHAALRSN